MSDDSANRLPRREIMIIEDNEDSLKYLSHILRDAGYLIRPATNGELGLRSVQAKQPDLILLDLRLPGINGDEVCRCIKADSKTKDIPVIFISAFSETELKVKAFDAGAIDYVTKPFDPSELLARVNSHLNLFQLWKKLAAMSENLFLEIEERKQSEQALRQSENRLSSFMQSATEGFVLYDSDLKLVMINNAALKFFPSGTKLEDLTGEYLLELAPGLEKPERYNKYLNVLKTGKAFFSDDIVSIPQYGDISISLSAFKVDDGLGFVFTDVTERKRAEEELRESENRLKLVLDATSEGAWDWNIKTGEVLFSSHWKESLGYSEEEVPHHISFREDIVHPDDMPQLQIVLQKYLDGETTRYEFENRLRMKNGEYRWNLDRGKVVEWDTDGKPLRMVGTDTDITGRKQAENEARERRKEFLHVSRLSTVGEMASGLAHELNQPLCAILTYANICLRTSDHGIKDMDTFRDNLKIIASQTKLAGNIINRIKNFVRKRTPSHTTVNINEVVHETTDILGLLLRDNNIELDLQLDAHVPLISVDAIQIEQVLINLATNAIESMQKVSTRNHRLIFKTSLRLDHFLEIAISDTGNGLSETIDKMLEPFFTTKKDGLGIGLSISRTIVEAHGGILCGETNPDYGYTFKVTFPVENANDKTSACE